MTSDARVACQCLYFPLFGIRYLVDNQYIRCMAVEIRKESLSYTIVYSIYGKLMFNS